MRRRRTRSRMQEQAWRISSLLSRRTFVCPLLSSADCSRCRSSIKSASLRVCQHFLLDYRALTWKPAVPTTRGVRTMLHQPPLACATATSGPAKVERQLPGTFSYSCLVVSLTPGLAVARVVGCTVF
ncbi:hypothetical protein CSUI_000685 [Cystoisospora suis]|uniref:Uncharacterized protein n=1 Tax=Cystoisospora suis TaxID=483139 RepID=A0A2C6LEK0_9APIC|nr:hypothetical protein CSUI_000685 [Cystoisospora suis]